MRDTAAWVLWAATLACASAARADVVPKEDPQFMRAALVVTLLDRLERDCARGRGHSADEQARLRDWVDGQGVASVRARLTQLQGDSAAQAWLTALRNTVDREYPRLAAQPCESALAMIRLPDAQFRQTAPELLARLGPAAPPVVPMAAAPPAVPLAAARAALLRDIDSFGFHSAAAMGVGGFITTRIFPVVLFRNGDALLDVEGLAHPGGLAAHRDANADDWTRWRRAAGELQIESTKRDGAREWRKLHFQTTYQELPDGFRLDGRYRSLSGVGNLAMGGSQSVTVFSEYSFARDGSVRRGGGVGSTAAAGDVSTVTAQAAPGQRGRYEVRGLTLQIRWDDGSTETRIIVADPTDPKTGLWLDGVSYVRR